MQARRVCRKERQIIAAPLIQRTGPSNRTRFRKTKMKTNGPDGVLWCYIYCCDEFAPLTSTVLLYGVPCTVEYGRVRDIVALRAMSDIARNWLT